LGSTGTEQDESMAKVDILEVAPRDGFQAVKPFIPTEIKIALIEELAACGFKRLEIGSFVSPKAIPQLADIGEVLRRARLPKGLRIQALVPNAKGLEMAMAAGVREVVWVISVSESHNRANVNRTVDESFRALEAAWSGLGRDRPKLRLALSTCFDCPWEGRIPEDKVYRLVERALLAAPEIEIAICDTTGRASPDQVGSLFGRLLPRYGSPSVSFAYHGHDTYGLGVANAIEAYRQGVCDIDGAAGGLGGCPFAPGAAGNTATEDLVFAFEHMGVSTGTDLGKLLEAADGVSRVAPEQAGGKVRVVPRKRALSGFGAATVGVGA
jgi:hydroxymethylglutaryl-CoA lyase